LLDFATSFYLPRRFPRSRRIAVTAALLIPVLLAGCRRAPIDAVKNGNSASARRLRADLALVPADAHIVISVDFDRLRAMPSWNGLAATSGKEAALLFDGFAKGTGIDLLSQVRRVLVAFPGDGRADQGFTLIAEVASLDETRVAAWLGRQHDERTTAIVHGGHRIVLAKGAWATSVAALAKGDASTPSATGNAELRRLCERAVGDHVLWFAAIVPAALRRDLIAQARFPDLASLARLWGTVDVDSGMRVESVAELSNEADARSLAHRLSAYLNAAKRHPDMLAQGLSPYLEGARLVAQGPLVRATLEAPAAQQGDLLERIGALAKAAWTKTAASR